MKKCFLIILFLAALFTVSFSSAQASQLIDPAKGLVLSNDCAKFEFEPGGMGLSAMVDLKSGYNHIQPVERKHLLWEIAFGKGTQIVRINNNYKPCNYARIDILPNGNQLAVMEWNELRWWEEDSVVTIQVTVELPKNDGIAKWRIFVENLSDYWGLWEVSCPKINGFPGSGVYGLARPTFGSGGQLLKEWKGKIKERYPSGGWPMQFLALNKDKDAVYLATMDPDARAKDFIADAGEKQISILHYPENMGIAGSDYPDYYPVEFGVYQGSWLEAAHHYRVWALQQKWTQAGPVSQRIDMPDIIKNVGLWTRDDWVWNIASGDDREFSEPNRKEATAGDPHQMDEPFFEVQKRMGVPMALHWYNWHHMTFDNQYPYFLPAKPGFNERVKELVNSGLLIMPYINGVSADMNVPNWDKFGPHAIVDEAGGYKEWFYWDGAGRLTSMCPSQEFWHDKISVLVDSLVGYCGVNGVYIDQIAAHLHELCFNKNHGHPVGGGHYWATGYRDELRKVKSVAHKKGRKVVITSEAADEIYFDLLDANLTWAQPTDREIPLMEVVYSGYTLFFASPVDYRKSDRYFNYSQGQALIDGRQNGWINFGVFKPEYASKAEYFKQCGQYRVATKKYLTYGRLIQPLNAVNSIPTFTEEGFGFGEKHAGTVPSAEARLWQAEDGNLAIFLANYVSAETPFSYLIDPSRYGLKANSYQLTEVTPNGNLLIDNAAGIINRTESLGPNKIKVIEIKAVK